VPDKAYITPRTKLDGEICPNFRLFYRLIASGCNGDAPANSFRAWKCLRAMASFIGSKRVDRLKIKLERGLAILDPVCR